MEQTTWLDVFERINKGLIKGHTKFYYKNELYTYDDNTIYSNDTYMNTRFYLDEIFDTCYILVDLKEE